MRQSKLEELWVIYDTQENCFVKFGIVPAVYLSTYVY